MKNSQMLLAKGEKMEESGKILCKVMIGGAALLLLTLLIATMVEGSSAIVMCLTFTVHKSYSYVNLLVGVSYLAILVGAFGPSLYFNGLKLIGLGQIAINTDKE